MTIDEDYARAKQWFKRNANSLELPRPLYLIPGITDEHNGCWSEYHEWGSRVFTNWDAFAHFIEFPADDVFPTGSPRAGSPITDFIDMGELLRSMLRLHEPDTGSPMGRYDVVCHSMGSLDMAAALVQLDDARPIRQGTEIGPVYNFIAVDSPFRGVPNIDAKREMCDNDNQKAQCLALMVTAQQLQWVADKRDRILDRLRFLSCYATEYAFFVQVPKDSSRWLRDASSAIQKKVDYYAPTIDGVVHSSAGGITNSTIFAADMFQRLLEAHQSN